MDSADPCISLRGFSFAYPGGVSALAPIDLSIGHGEFVAILGPSGCGKSTLLRLVAGLLPTPRDGSLRVRREDDTDIACVFQSPALMPWASVAHNVALPLALAGRRDDAGIDAVLRLVGLDAFRNAYPRELSGGMQMRASIARALVTKPNLLLMDEPFAALDEITRQRLDDELRTLWQRHGLTVMFITHSIVEAVFLATRVVVMSERPGRIVGEVVIDAPQRDDAFRGGAHFASYCAEAGRLLRVGMSTATPA